MKTIELKYPHTFKEDELPETVAAIGFFDGIHRGHQHVIKAAVKTAQAQQLESAVITFHPHPSVVLNPKGKKVKNITPFVEKQAMIQQLGVDRLYIITFDHTLSQLLPEEFIEHFIVGLHIRHLIAGFDFTFGHKGQGTMENIVSYTKGRLKTTTIDKVEADDQKISSTRIRSLIRSGQIEQANLLLGRPYRMRGKVVKGAQRGRKIGYPTANLQLEEDVLLPKIGIYAVRVLVNNRSYEGMASIGHNPTFTNLRKPSTEINILDFDQNIYGETIVVDWHHFIRDERKFDGAEALIQQIEKDEKMIRDYFSKHNKINERL